MPLLVLAFPIGGLIYLVVEVLSAVIEDAELAPRHFRCAQKVWLDMARRAL